MRPGRRRFGVVSLPALDVRSRPDHRSELKSQLLMGEVVRRLALSRDGRWWKAENAVDRYVGWVRIWGLVEAGPRRIAVWRRRARGRVIVSHAEVRLKPGGSVVSPLFWNGRVIPGRTRGRERRVELPDGRRGWVSRQAVVVGSRHRPSLLDRVRALLGVPYLWGGRTSMGFDCSAFTQQVMLEQGVALPRDAAQQFRCTRPLRPREEPREGDLIFFGLRAPAVGHVGVVLGGGYYAHSRGRVRIGSVDPRNPLWDRELGVQFRGVRRWASARRRGGVSAESA